LSDGRWIKHTYNGSGTLIKTEYSTGEYWEFIPGIVFKNGAFYQMVTPEGRAIYEGEAWKLEFDYKDHTGNTRASFKADGNRLVHTAKTDTDPWGVILKTGQENNFQNRHEMQGHEREKTFGLNRINFGARTYNPTIGRFDRVDRYSEKYTSLSTFQYAANNPIRYVDINGDSLWIAHKGNNYLYNDGKLYNKDGSQFDGKMKGFLKQTVNALNQMNATEIGSSMLRDLSSSTNNFYIVQNSGNEFKDDRKSINASYAQQINTDDSFQHLRPAPNGGAGGTIYWNPKGASVWTTKGYQSNATTNLGHELFHAYDANNGLMDGRLDQNLKRNEWQASYRENLLRGELKLPYREYYRSESNNGVISPLAPRILDVNNNPIRPSWLPK
jgi:RHS repeat-associated protein